MDTNVLIELAAKMVEALGMLADNQDRIAQNIRPTYGGRAFYEMAEEIRKMAKPCETMKCGFVKGGPIDLSTRVDALDERDALAGRVVPWDANAKGCADE